MTDTNATRARYAANKQAFTDILGDPFAAEIIDGWYNTFKHRSTNRSIESKLGEGGSTPNPAAPSVHDFYCDVEKVVEQIIKDKTLLQKFVTTYIVGDIASSETLNQAERNRLEQRIGKLFRAYRIVPVAKYFTTMRVRRG